MRVPAAWALVGSAVLTGGLAQGCASGDRAGEAELTADVAFNHDSLGWVVDLALVGERVVAIDAMLAPAVHVFDRSTLRRLGSYGGRGDGPGEFRDPEVVVTGATEALDVVWILDGVHQRLTRLALSDIEAGGGVTPETFPVDGPTVGSLVRAPDGRWFAGGWITDGRVARYHPDRSYDRTIVGFPPEAAAAPGMTLLQAYESRVVADPAGGRLAAATGLAGLLEVFDFDGVPVARAAVPDPFPPTWTQGRSRSGRAVMSMSRETRYGFTDLAATERYLYALFSGRRVMQRGTPWATRELQVYSWEGDHVETRYLGREAETIAVDASDTWLYATGPDPAPWVARFRLRR